MSNSPKRGRLSDDRLLTLRELAAYLNLNERTLLKLVSEGDIPGVKIGNQWRFRKAMIDTWLDDQMLGVAPRRFEVRGARPAPQRMLALENCFQPRHIVPELVATSKLGVVEELAGLCGRLGLVRDETWFARALVERENIMPSAVGNGVAFLHTMYRHPEQVVKPFMVLGRSTRGVDFDALDGKITHLVFVLGLKFHELHLPWLAKLSQMFARTEATQALLEAPDAEAIFEVLRGVEDNLFPVRKERSIAS
jgi:PTS system nitrogen regulatory IIA component